jgi:acetyl-CoA synthetase
MKPLKTTSSKKKSTPTDHYPQLYQDFRWNVPEHFNIAEVCCHRWADDPKRVAIFHENSEGISGRLTYAELQRQANQLANLLRLQGVDRGDVVASIMPQRPETAITLMACLQLGAIAMPLSFLFGPEALEYRLQHSEAVALVLDASGLDAYLEIAARCPHLKTVITVDCPDAPADFHPLEWEAYIANMPAEFVVKKRGRPTPRF